MRVFYFDLNFTDNEYDVNYRQYRQMKIIEYMISNKNEENQRNKNGMFYQELIQI